LSRLSRSYLVTHIVKWLSLRTFEYQ
jgi:hypothetical protein